MGTMTIALLCAALVSLGLYVGTKRFAPSHVGHTTGLGLALVAFPSAVLATGDPNPLLATSLVAIGLVLLILGRISQR